MCLISALLLSAILAPACFAQTQAPSESATTADSKEIKVAKAAPADNIVSHQRSEQIAMLKATAHV